MKSAIAAVLLLCGSAAAWAQQPPAAAGSDSSALEQKIRDLEDRIVALEGEVRQLRATQQQPASTSPPAAQASAAAPAPSATPQATTTAEGQSTPEIPAPTGTIGGARGLGKVLNPDISMVGNFVSSAGHDPIRPTPAFEMRESELGLQAIIDPYARGDFFLSFGQEGVDLEEGFITFTSLPGGLVAKGGKMRAAFGKVNTMHTHNLTWIDRPLVIENLVGGEEGLNDAGVSVTRSFGLPRDTYLEFTGQLYRGESADIFHNWNKDNVAPVLRLRGYRDLTESTNLDIGLSYSQGHNDAGPEFLTHLYGVDATLRWKPLRRAIYHSFIARSEFIWSQRQQAPATQRAFGWYASADYQLARRWFLGGRVDFSDRSRDAALRDQGGSLVLTFWPSEFSQVRGQYRRTRYAEGIDTNELRMQLMFSLGAHGAHPF